MAATTRAALRATRAAVLLGAVVWTHEARALDPLKTPSQYVQHLWQQSEHGLPQNYVPAVVQTRDGYLWLTTQEGLTRFDGVRFVVFSTTTVPQLGTNDLDALHEDRSGALWIGALGGGLVRYAGGKFTAFKRADGLVNDYVLAIHEARDGALWIGTRGGVSKLQGGHFTSFTTAQGLANDTVSAIAEERDGTMWFGTDGGVSRFAGGSFTTVKEGLADPSVGALAADSDGTLWIGSVGGLDRLQNGVLHTLRSFGAVHSLLRDRHGNLWIGAEGGLARLSSGPSADGKATPVGVLTMLEGTDAHPFDA
ncbi:MAG: two-component regulator propeller domain-containing protein, partial [Polyangiaceae bacterium]